MYILASPVNRRHHGFTGNIRNAEWLARNGLPIVYEAQNTMPADGKPGPCFDHSGAREAQDKFIKTLVETLGKYDNVLVWNTWQEVGYWSERLVGQPVCYCDNTLTSFRNWLKRQIQNHRFS